MLLIRRLSQDHLSTRIYGERVNVSRVVTRHPETPDRRSLMIRRGGSHV